MSRVYEPLAHNSAFLALVEEVCAALTASGRPEGVPVGNCSGEGLTAPYAVFYPLGATGFDGSLSPDDLDSDVSPSTQITFIGETPEQVQWLQGKVRAGVVGKQLVVAGRELGVIRLRDEQPARRDDNVNPFVYWSADQYGCFSTPA